MHTIPFFTRRAIRQAMRHFLEFLFLFIILPLVTCPLWGQVVQKTKLSSDSYALWGEVQLEAVSKDGEWASFIMHYQNGLDTLFVSKTSGLKRYSYAGGENPGFSGGTFFFYQSGSDLQIVSLSTGKTEIIPNIQKFTYIQETDQLVILQKSNILIIRSLKEGNVLRIDHIDQYSLCKSASRLACIRIENKKYSVLILDLKNAGKQNTAITIPEYIDNLTWQSKGLSLAFTKGTKRQKPEVLFHYILKSNKLFKLNVPLMHESDKNITEHINSNGKIMISNDLKKVFFSTINLENQNDKIQDIDVEIWKAEDPITYQQKKNREKFVKKNRLILWVPSSNQVKLITTDQMTNVMLSGDCNYAILSDPNAYEPQFEYEGPRDFYIMDLNTFEKKLLLKKHYFFPWSFSLSTGGKYLAYFKDKNWWTYDFKTGKHQNITAETGAEFTAKERSLIPKSICGTAGWTADEKQIILYDKFDLWAVYADGSSFKKLTKGNQSDIVFRVATTGRSKTDYFFDTPASENLSLSKGLILTAQGNDGKTGYYSWNWKNLEKPIVYNSSFVDQLFYSCDKKTFIFREQKFDLSPSLAVKNSASHASYFFNSNLQQKNFFWGKSELIEYQNSKGVKLKGALFYPADYDPMKKYPMIVNIYENKSSELNLYVNPSYYEESGLNLTIMTLEGYFVLFPDISLEYQNPGVSAADCVISAVEKVNSLNIVDKKKIGLIGHSFGGYESLFIITKTNIFAAAISSGAITDLVSFYHNINKSTGRPDMWRFINEQWNMGDTPYALPDAYFINSPINFVQNIQTPVLLWSGKNDTQVDTSQSIEFYLALRRLGKKACMLLYPGQSHLIADKQKQKDITIRTIQWFDYYLKDRKQSWISSDFQ